MTFNEFVNKSNKLGYVVKDVYCDFGCYNYDHTVILDKNGRQFAHVIDGDYGNYTIDTPNTRKNSIIRTSKELSLINKFAFTNIADRKQPSRPLAD